MARFRLIPREEKFYHDFAAIAAELRTGARFLEQMLAPDHPVWDKADEIKELEHKCDFLAHEVLQRLYRTFVTPIDREDIYALAQALDDVMDAIDASAAVVRLYKIDKVRPEARELAAVISALVEQIHAAMGHLETRAGVHDCALEIGRLEAKADRIHQQAVGQLFEQERDPIAVMKWKEILDLLEGATDRCKDVATVLEGVVVKHA